MHFEDMMRQFKIRFLPGAGHTPPIPPGGTPTAPTRTLQDVTAFLCGLYEQTKRNPDMWPEETRVGVRHARDRALAIQYWILYTDTAGATRWYCAVTPRERDHRLHALTDEGHTIEAIGDGLLHFYREG